MLLIQFHLSIRRYRRRRLFETEINSGDMFYSNVVNDTFDPFDGDTETMFIIYAVCHTTGMSSACANPLLYGWLNDNFRKEFCEIWASVTGKRRSASQV